MAATDWSKPPGSIRLFLGGDVMTGRAIDQLFAQHNPVDFGKPDHVPATQYLAWSAELNGAEHLPLRHDHVWGVALGLLDHAAPDFRLVNLETAITRSDHWQPKTFNFRMHPANIGCLTAARLDGCVLANNHVLDFGAEGLVETLDTLDAAGIGHAGAGRNAEEAAKPLVHTLPNGQRLLVFAWATRDSGVPSHWRSSTDLPGVQLLHDDPDVALRQISDQIAEHRLLGDLVIVSLHWGGNWVAAVPETHRRMARTLIDRHGVDLIHGHSAHHPLGIERHRGRLILFGCGDLINDYEGHPRYRPWRHHLGALYLADVEADSGQLMQLRAVPVQRRRFRLERPSIEDEAWLLARIRRANATMASTG